MKKSPMFIAMFLPALLFACTQLNSPSREPVSREKVVENLSPILDMEQRGTQLTMAMQKLPLVAQISPEDARALKEHYDVYYVYHSAAATSLAEGDFDAYRNHVRVGLKELDSIEAKLKDVLKKSSGDPHAHQSSPDAKSTL